ncbi:MAG: hypothetical protein RIT02_3353 [Planctomycetota bacterium]
MSESPSNLDQLIAELLLRLERGEQVSLEDFLARHPQEARELQQFVDDLCLVNGRPEGLQDWDKTLIGPAGVAEGSDLQPGTAGRTELSADAVLVSGRLFDRYELLGAPLGSGGMGVVYRARLLGTGVQVALKQLRRTDAEERRLFLAEIEAAAGLRHPNIVPVYHAGETDGALWYTMALISGGSLNQHRELFGGSVPVIVAIMIRVTRAVYFAHQRRVLHRDLKPANILLDDQGEPHVADFGLAVRIREDGVVATTHPTGGSLPWLAPEIVELSQLTRSERQERSRDVLTTAVDVWSLGVILYELLTGERPFKGATAEELAAEILAACPRPLREIRAEIPRELETICLRCLRRPLYGRYESASALALDLQRWQVDQPLSVGPRRVHEWVLQFARREPGFAGVIAAITTLVLVLILGVPILAREFQSNLLSSMVRDCEWTADHVAENVYGRFELMEARVRDAAKAISAVLAREELGKESDIRRLLEELSGSEVLDSKCFQHAFVLDEAGRIMWASEGFEAPGAGRYQDRDYFRNAVNGEVYISRAYQSTVDQLDKIAFSIRLSPVDSTGQKEGYVLAANMLTDSSLSLVAGQLGNAEHVVCLVAATDPSSRASSGRQGRARIAADEHVIFVHPSMRSGAAAIPLMLPVTSADDRPFASVTDYRDPLQPGQWGVASARIRGTGISVLVQRSYELAAAPYRRLVSWALWSMLLIVVTGLVFRGAMQRLGRRERERRFFAWPL